MSYDPKNTPDWSTVYDQRSDIDELYQKWCDNENKPKLAIYLRTSKSNTNETNVRQQVVKLMNMFKSWLKDGNLHRADGEDIYHDIILEADIDYRGSMVNENLKKLLSQLSFHDDIFIVDVTRVSRMNPETDEFKKLYAKLFSDYKYVYIENNGKPKPISREDFLHDAHDSYQWYLKQNDQSKKGNEVKRSQANLRRDTLLFYLIGDGFTNKQLARKFNVSERTICRDKATLKQEGYYSYEPQPNGRKVKVTTSIFD